MMNRTLAMNVANTVLYEGYMLYPYRASAMKNRQHWNFGIIYPPKYEEVKKGTERSRMHSECLLKLTGETVVHVQLRFLHLLSREVLRAVDGHLEPAASVIVDGELVEPWDEGVERSVEFDVLPSDELEQFFQFSFDGLNESESLRDVNGEIAAELARSQDELQGTILTSWKQLRDGVMKLSIDVDNSTVLPAYATDRDSVLLSSFLSAHTILAVDGGEFVSLLEPPEEFREEAKACHNIGNFPVLVGAESERDMLLCSPIVLYDYPQIAPESAGDFYDATEMDEMLTLRVMTLTDQEKKEIRSGDARIRTLLQRTEDSAREQLTKTHGIIRGMRPAS
jgi:hydrogenase maturation protease